MENNASNWQLFLDQQLENLHKSPDLLNQFKNLKTNYQRIDFVHSFGQLIEKHFKSLNFTDDQKNDGLSESYRKKGNSFYAKKDGQNALNNYNLALLYAPVDSKSLYLAYSNRSAVFYDLAMFDKSLEDLASCELHLPLAETNFSLILKLAKRKINCLIKLNQGDSLLSFRESCIYKMLVQTASDLGKESELVEINKLIEQCGRSNLKKSHPSADHEPKSSTSFINDCVDVQFSDKNGRHCLAKRNIRAGEVLFTEKAYCSIILPMAGLNYCDLCFKSLYNEQNRGFEHLNIHPCSQCCGIFYCSDRCRVQSETDEQNHHKFECGILKTLLHNLGLAHLAFRILNSTSQELILKYSDIQTSDSSLIDYKMDNCANNYCQVFNLLTHESATHPEDLFKYSLTALLLGQHYAGVVKNDSKKFLKLVSSVTLRHLLQCICNAHAITGLKDEANVQQTFSRDQHRYATAIYPRVSLLNHSCNSNVVSSFKENSDTIVVKASRTIRKSEQIFNSYGPHYIKMTFFQRKQSLSEQYHFDCDCSECLDQSSIFTQSKLTGLRCFYCTGTKVLSSGKVSLPNDVLLVCSECGKAMQLANFASRFEFLDSFLDKMDTESMSDECTKMSVKKLEDMVKDYRKYLCINEDLEIDCATEIDANMRIFYLDFSKLIDLLARLSCNSNNLLHGCWLLEKNVTLLEFVYESKRNEVIIELGHEFFKLAELQCVVGQQRKALDSINKAISIAECVYSKESALLNEYHQVQNYIKSFLKK
ncbi:SET and MYND domain-containing 4-like [Brachionus plicatilis]|uniref:SET and MYND domain-containing 4-like n=1 Tax=Brachionus plicatilis TaxID=10195 RepID=A0A3M7T0L9_BRAPC|nr:SET and MYND domain-containing 4-like [Brachionus plicatilis]